MDEQAKALADAIDAALAGWVVRSVERTLERAGRPPEADVMAAAAEAGA